MDKIKFYAQPNKVVWDRERKKVLARFDAQGQYTTSDKRTQELLKAGGYLGDYDSEDYTQPTQGEANTGSGADPDIYAAMSLDELKEHADAAGVKYAANIGAKTLAKRLREQVV
jgi:hypothetical protein